MTVTFERTLRSLAAEGRALHQWGIALSVFAIGVLAAWLALAEVPVVVVSSTARLEVAQRQHPVTAQVDGRLLESLAAVGQRVRAGDVLARIDSTPEALHLAEEQSRLAGTTAEIEALEAARVAAAAGRREAAAANASAISEARERLRAATAAAEFAASEARRTAELARAGLVAAGELEGAQRDAHRADAEGAAAALAIERAASEAERDFQDRAGAIRRLEQEIVAARSLLAATRQRVAALEQELDRRVVRAPVTGTVAEWAGRTAGEVVEQGQRLGVVLPDGEIHAVADFNPGEALGRIRPGQVAELRLDGFPWTQYGGRRAVVEGIAAETREATIRVVLAVDRVAPSRLPLQHGLPGSVTVEVERLSPLRLLLGTIGARLDQRPAAAAATPLPSQGAS